jgi:glycosyltransferase involved in cell wall biosynthesis
MIMQRSAMVGVSFVVPVHNGAECIQATLASVFAQADGRAMEVIVVDDGSTDESAALVRTIATTRPLSLIQGPNRGAAAALNAGIQAARFPIICQVDQDVVLCPGWMTQLAAELVDPRVGAAQGRYAADPSASVFVRVMGWDLEQRYAAIGHRTDHVCTGNCAYRAEALERVGLFDESLGYGYDNDMSYRLIEAGYQLTYCVGASSLHRWREGLAGYLAQQYGFGYGRLDLVAKHPGRVFGDRVSPALMMIHPLLMFVTLSSGCGGLLMSAAGMWATPAYSISLVVLGLLAVERLIAGTAAASRFHTLAPLLFPVIHLARDVAWVTAIVVWWSRRVLRAPSIPSHSMRPRDAGSGARLRARDSAIAPRRTTVDPGEVVSRNTTPHYDQITHRSSADSPRVLALIPAHNEAASLPALVAEVKAQRPDLTILVIDDGSTDETSELLEQLGVQWLRFPERMGVGAAIRAGLRYAVRLKYSMAVRLDGDGQHRPEDIDRLLAPLARGESDVVTGTRYLDRHAVKTASFRWLRRPLAACLTAIAGRRVSDPTSGCYAFGPRAVRLLAEHHPTGYPEPELQLFLSRNGLRVLEVPVAMRSRANGKTSLTPSRLALASARVLLAIVIVPLRCAVRQVP